MGAANPECLSPRTRGCSLLAGLDQRQKHLIPAHAGVILRMPYYTAADGTYPRARGGDPPEGIDTAGKAALSPRTRG